MTTMYLEVSAIFAVVLHHFVLAKLASSSIRVRNTFTLTRLYEGDVVVNS